MRVSLWMLGGFFIAVLLMDLSSVWVVRSNIIAGLDKAMDAAMIEGLEPSDASGGHLVLNESQAVSAIKRNFRNNLQLNDALENRFLKDTQLKATLVYDKGKPKLAVDVKTRIIVMLPQMFGLEGIPIGIHDVQYHLSKYR